MSREFWARAFPNKRGASQIKEFNEVQDWSNPPDKNTETKETTTDIANATAKYFAYLGSKRARSDETEAAAETMLNLLETGATVNETTSNECGKDLTVKEIEATCSSLPTGKSPGPDRIPNELYKMFASKIAPLLARFYNEARSSKSLPKGFNEGIVVILYKKGNRRDVRNYRPITLLNSDYKIMTRILAKRMLSIVTQFVSDNQIGFVPFTFIAESAMLVKLLQAHLDNIDDGGILVFCDMEKAFDRCDWNYLNKAIETG